MVELLGVFFDLDGSDPEPCILIQCSGPMQVLPADAGTFCACNLVSDSSGWMGDYTGLGTQRTSCVTSSFDVVAYASFSHQFLELVQCHLVRRAGSFVRVTFRCSTCRRKSYLSFPYTERRHLVLPTLHNVSAYNAAIVLRGEALWLSALKPGNTEE